MVLGVGMAEDAVFRFWDGTVTCRTTVAILPIVRGLDLLFVWLEGGFSINISGKHSSIFISILPKYYSVKTIHDSQFILYNL